MPARVFGSGVETPAYENRPSGTVNGNGYDKGVPEGRLS